MPRTVQISTRMRNTLESLLDEYYEDVNATELAPTSKRNYVAFAESFVRWVNGEFTPGAQLSPRNELAERRRANHANGHTESVTG
jgi:hypothetical protein